MIPVCISLLPYKNIATYTRLFTLIKAACLRYGLQFEPANFFIDFEMAVITTITQVFPNSRIRGCLFHFAQALWRQVQENGFVVSYRDNQAFNRLVRRAMALPLIPPEEAEDVWMSALEEANHDELQQMAFL